MRVAANRSRVSDFEAPSIRAALELLSDEEPTEQQGELICVETERQAREAAEAKAETERQARLVAEQRSEEWRQQSIKERDEKREAQQQNDLLRSRKQKIRTQTPADYEATKAKAARSRLPPVQVVEVAGRGRLPRGSARLLAFVPWLRLGFERRQFFGHQRQPGLGFAALVGPRR